MSSKRTKRSRSKKSRASKKLKLKYPRFNEGTDSYAELLRTAYRIEKQRHKSLLGVHDVEQTYTARGAELHARLGYKGYLRHVWEIEEDGGYREHSEAEDESSFGGLTNWIVDRHKRMHTIVVIFQVADWSSDPELAACVNLPLFFHEVGHVDDYEKAINFNVGGTTDLGKAEEYAHHFACRQCIKLGLHNPLGFYLRCIDSCLAKLDVELVSCAAVAFRECDENQEYRDFAGVYYEKYASLWE